ncbi:MAG: hypothetical protein IT285_15150 [Bdellovibrionales bacterium]|nr:hypothetical protein [Bdellovibrionales bacterium]
MKFSYACMTLTLLMAATRAGAAELPRGWVLSPSGDERAAEPQAEPTDELTREIEGALGASARSMDAVGFASAGRVSANRASVPWHLEAFTTEIGVSASGKIGVLSVKATPAVQVYWRKKPQTTGREEAELVDEAAAPADIDASIDGAVALARGEGFQGDEGALRARLREFASEAESGLRAAEAGLPGGWWVSGFRLDLSVDASGVVNVVTVGGDVRLRLEWKRLEASRRTGESMAAPRSAWALGLAEVSRVLAEELARAEEESEIPTGLTATSLRVGVGMNAKGSVGVVKAGGTALAHLNFSRDPSRSGIGNAPVSGAVLSLLLNPAIHPDAIQVPRERFRKGLAKAFRMSGYFAERALRSESTRWGLWQVKTGLDLSVGGDIGVVAASGLVSMEIAMQNRAWGKKREGEAVAARAVEPLRVERSDALAAFVSEALSRDSVMESVACDRGADEDWRLLSLLLRLRAQVGFEVPGFAKLVIQPEAELVWQRPAPQGWGSYHP